ncbi:outer membrane beta-barrel protein [Gluconobacter kanchanaburiensis]|uniref:Porin n=1 Tax=Gluconobacter kanchanaburiensis NBRC 103587 TaxID=1307948 RepID=A0A511B6M3_9PROT|nr:outer membrane beta-barrel protein [Gluconobacter kanchanaburiensis]MBF0861686.1 outer membrane beta-barrel protein [Gluconobacter kanchanaburiensis]GBR67232.1 hypothetical protein AA103587_0182 [Gluconobacter kanchanaburiensis NBRC 103587]GEK95333.1 hypothetical protein GKA01_05300 [Gluconobacter kanchanaburiensis NBRC 103587]
MRQRFSRGLGAILAVLAELGVSAAGAQTVGEQTASGQGKAWTDEWFSDVSFGAQIEGGVMGSFSHPASNLNFGQLLSPYADQATLNQLTFTLTKPVDPIGGGYGLGMNLRMLYGSDARSYTIAGVSDRWINGRYQAMPVFANIALHMPWFTARGLDGQIGILPSPMGVETLDPSTRAFYTLAYTTEYSTPFEHVGAMFQLHLDDHFDLQFGADTGNQTSFGRGDNNGRPAGYIGVTGNTLADGHLSFTYLLRVGPENAVRSLGARANGAMRYWNDLNGTWAFSKKWSVTAELNQLHDEGLHADTYSAVVWGGWHIHPNLTVNARAELYRDNTGSFVASFAENEGYAQAMLGNPTRSESAPATTYGALTLNTVWRPDVGHHVKLLQFRPELRFDRALNGTRPFDDGHHMGRILFGADMTLGF